MGDFKLICLYRRQIDILLIVLFAVLAFTPWAIWLSGDVDLSNSFAQPGSARYPLGADNLGRDLLVRLSGAVRHSVVPLWACVLGAAFVGLLAVMVFVTVEERSPRGLGARTASLIMKLMSAVSSVPVFLLVFASVLAQERTGLAAMIGPIAIVVFARTVASLHNLIDRDKLLSYWVAGSASGWSRFQLVWRYGVSGAWLPTLGSEVLFSLTVVVSIEGALSYLGMGIAEPTPSFGNMLSSHFDDYLRGRFWVLTTVAAAFFLTAYVPSALRSIFTGTVDVHKRL